MQSRFDKYSLNNALEFDTIFPAIAKALAHAEMAKDVENYRIGEHEFAARCSAYVISQRYGVDTRTVDVYGIPKNIETMEAEDVKKVLGDVHSNVKSINARMNESLEQTQNKEENNKVLTQNVSIGYNAKLHRRNFNTLVVGGSGAGKTRFYAKPNIMQANTSFVVLDPKGEILRDTGGLLKSKGYEVRVLDLINMERSDRYNPFKYIESDNDVQRLVTNLFKSTTPKGSQSNDPFWDTAASMLLLALIFYLRYEAPPEEQNFPMVMELLRAGDIDEENEAAGSALDDLFGMLETDNPAHIALKYYKAYRSGSAKTLKSIQITLAARLEKFNLESLATLTSTDELE